MTDAERLFAAHHAAIYRYLVRLVGDPDAAADAAQEAFVRLIERPPAGSVARAWLYTVATNAALESARTRGRRERLLAAAPADAPVPNESPRPDAYVEGNERRMHVGAALAALTERDRTALLMREEGFSHREIADALGTTTGSVGTVLARALGRLSAALPVAPESL
jgi:RNA polymerase sigma-70 factor (ECF subfamily)